MIGSVIVPLILHRHAAADSIAGPLFWLAIVTTAVGLLALIAIIADVIRHEKKK